MARVDGWRFLPAIVRRYGPHTMVALHELTAHELVDAFTRRELSPLDVARAALARIDAWEPRIRAMYRVARDAALDQARAAEARWQAGAPRSALDGVPI